MENILDVSHHQEPKDIDYDKLSKQVKLVIVRTQYGSIVEDKFYKTHHAEFKKRGVHTAGYAWVRGISISDMEVEATDFYNRTKEFNPTFWLLDVEEKSMDDMRNGISAYVKKLRELGAKKIGIYVANHLYKDFNLNLDEVEFSMIPSYGKNDGTVEGSIKPDYPCDLWQFSSVCKLDGYNGSLDLSVINSNKVLSFFTGEDEVKPAPKPIVKPVPVAQPVAKNPIPNKIVGDTYKVQSNDNLTSISIRAKVSIDNLVKWNNINNPNVIQVGDILKLKAPVAKKPAPKPSTKTITIQKGDTLSELAANYKTSVANLMKLNG